MMQTLLVMVGLLAACSDHKQGSGKQGSQPGAAIDPSSSYGRLRAAAVTAVATFPTDPSKLPRCTPAISDVLVSDRQTLAEVLHVPVNGAPTVAGAISWHTDVAVSKMEDIEAGSKSAAPGWFDQFHRIALFQQTMGVEPKMSDCRSEDPASLHPSNRKMCDLTPGKVAGDVVVFDPAGKAECASSVVIEGPMSASLLGDRGIGDVMGVYVRGALDMMFSWRGQPHTRWGFLDRSELSVDFLVTIDGAVVAKPQSHAND